MLLKPFKDFILHEIQPYIYLIVTLIFLIFIMILAILILLYFIFKRRIDINLMLLFVDINSLFGLYWRLVPEYCSPMKIGFNPAMPLEYYADFNKAIELKVDYIVAYNDRGFAYYLKGSYDQAIADYSKAIQLNYLLSLKISVPFHLNPCGSTIG